MTNKEKIIKFLELKNDFIFRETDIEYIDSEDIDDVNTWSEELCEELYEGICFEINKNNINGVGSGVCVWCAIHNPQCSKCGYGIRHGVCVAPGSLYSQYRSQHLIDAFSNDVYKNIIKEIEGN